jgi:hypothetical protein
MLANDAQAVSDTTLLVHTGHMLSYGQQKVGELTTIG